MLRHIRRKVFAVLERNGILGAVAASRWRNRRLLILCYHGIALADEHQWNSQLYVSVDTFRERLEILRRGGYTVLPLDEALARLAAGNLPPRSVAITIDDGAHDFHEQAVPLLQEYAYPATVYLTTYYCGFQRPVFDTGVSYVLWRSGLQHASMADLIPGLGAVDLTTQARRRSAAARIRDLADRARLSGPEKDDLLRRVAGRLRVDYDAVFARRLLYLMTPDEVRDVASAGFDVQLHTHRHRTPDDRGAFLREIDDNRAGIERILGPTPRAHFCYPSGVYRPSFVRWLREAGVRSATTCDFRLATAGNEPLLLPRLVDTGNITPLEFEACLSGVADLLPHRRRAVPSPRRRRPAELATDGGRP